MKLSKIWLNGNELAAKHISRIKETIVTERVTRANFYEEHKKWADPQLHIVNVGFDDASLSYIKKKADLASSIGIHFQLHQFIEK
jgi:5,10-methylene-tetrahydrofolate dehydrogenase/methenyl tetrahydrofolate cyclohydrolase